MATHPSILAWRVPWTEGPGGHRKESDAIEQLSTAQPSKRGPDVLKLTFPGKTLQREFSMQMFKYFILKSVKIHTWY